MINTHPKSKIRWGILGTAKIAREKLIPAIQASSTSEVVAVASRTLAQANEFALNNNIEFAYGDYQQLLDSPEVEAVYIPLPNHLHVPWALKAIAAGKHVLSEKPIGLKADDARALIAAASQQPQLKVMEAFMYRFHPQWAKARELLKANTIGKINSIDAVFTYYNREASNVRNQVDIGGGGLMDIGCYCISACRYLFNAEPKRALGLLDIDAEFGVDKHTHGILNFESGQASIYCSTQSEPTQKVTISGEKGAIVLDMPFYQPDNCSAKTRIFRNRIEEVIELPGCDHYVNQIDAFAHAINQDLAVPTPLSDALANMQVIDALFASHQNKSWVSITNSNNEVNNV